MKALLLYNIKAGRGRAHRNVGRAADIFRHGGWEVVQRPVEFGKNPFDGCGDVDAAIVAGGDGTLNYVVNRMKESGTEVRLGILPSGTANDFAGAAGMSSDVAEAARQIVGGQSERLDCGEVNGVRFVNIFSFGLFTTTSQRTPDERKRRWGKAAYVAEGLGELRALRALPLRVEHDGGEFATEAFTVLVFNGETAGRFRLARGASLRDGLFDVLILERGGFLRSCLSMIRYLAGGNPSQVRSFRTSRMRITTTAEGVATDVDGQRGPDFPIDIRCAAGELNVVCPKNQRK